MKKATKIVIFIALAAVIGIGAAAIFINNNPSLGKEEAQQIALKDAGVQKKDAQGLRVQLENEDGMKFYDVSFTTKAEGQTTKYEYDIDAETGAIYAKDAENHGNVANKPAANAAQGAPQQAQGEIAVEQAKAIALEHAGVSEADVIHLQTEYEHEATGNEWNVEFETATTDYDYDISATDGRIVQSSNEPRD